MSRAIFGSLSLKNHSFLELFDAANNNSIQLTPPSSVSTNSVITLPVVASDTLVARTTTDTLTNKVINGASNTLTVLAASQISGLVPIANGGTNTSSSTGTGSLVLANSPTLVTPALGTPSAAVLTNATGLPLTSGVTGTLPLGNGGTGQTTALAAFDALSPLTTTGDLLYYNGTHNARVAIGTTGYILTVVGGVPAWAAPGSSGSYAATWSAVTHTVTISNASPGVVTDTAHGLVNGQSLYLTTSGTLPTGLSPNVQYFVVSATTNTYSLALTYGGTAINTSSAGSGTHTANITSYNAVHNLGTVDVICQAFDLLDGSDIEFGQVVRWNTNNVIFNGTAEPSGSGTRVLISSVI